MSTEKQHETAPRTPTEKWRHLPEKVDAEDLVESHAEDPPPSTPESAGNPDTNWMLRYS